MAAPYRLACVTSDDHSTLGFDTVPDRPVVVTFALFVVVTVSAAALAVAFKESALWIVERYGDHHDPTLVAEQLPWPAAAAIVAASVIVATSLGMWAARRWPQRSGLEAIAASARGEDRPISLRATLVRSFGTWVMVVGLVPIGRESAIIESGGALGSSIARRFGGRGAAMATAGIAAAFATAYHAPIAAVLYLEEHLKIRRSRRAVTFGVGGALMGHLIATQLLGGTALLPRVDAAVGDLVVAGVVAVLPATLAARAFLEARNRLAPVGARAPGDRVPRWLWVVTGAAVAGVTVAVYPLTAGNGLDALHQAALLGSVGAAFVAALAIGKFAGTTSVFATGAPGGALTPTMTVAAGTSLGVVALLDAWGVSSIDVWGVVLLAAAVGIGVGLRSPLTGALLVPEMTGDLRLVPATAGVVAVAYVLDRGLDRIARLLGQRLPTALRDEDA